MKRTCSAPTNNCLSQDASGINSLRVIVKVMPPPVSSSSSSIIGYSDLLLFFKHETHFQYQLYPELRDSVNMFLQQYHLFYRYNLPLDTTVLMLLDNVSQSMQSSPMQYTFWRLVPSAFIAAHEATPLMLLGLVARGIPRASDGVIRLHGMPVSPSLTLQSIAVERTTYASPLCIEDDSLVHMGLLSFIYFNSSSLNTFYVAPQYLPITFVENSHNHQCLSPQFYSTFSVDSPASDVDTSGGEADGNTEHGDEDEVASPEVSQNHQVT